VDLFVEARAGEGGERGRESREEKRRNRLLLLVVLLSTLCASSLSRLEHEFISHLARTTTAALRAATGRTATAVVGFGFRGRRREGGEGG
jgi:hypothetical protein